MTPVELRVFYWLIGFFNIVLLIFIVSTVIILKKAEVGTGMSYNSFFTCVKCGHKHVGTSDQSVCVNCGRGG